MSNAAHNAGRGAAQAAPQVHHRRWCLSLTRGADGEAAPPDCNCGAWREHERKQLPPSVRGIYSRVTGLATVVGRHIDGLKQEAIEAQRTSNTDGMRKHLAGIIESVNEFAATLDMVSVAQAEFDFQRKR